MTTNGTVTKTEFTWVETDEPHATRRKLILAKHPEMAELFVKEPRTLWIVLAILASQILMASIMRHQSWPVLLFFAYVYGGTVNHTLQLAVHELSHNLAFDSELANSILGIVGNFATGMPSAVMFKRYHMEHHTFQGVDGVDVDVPTMAEVQFFNSTWKKALWMFLQPAFYALRPLVVKPKHVTKMTVLNTVAVFAFDAVIIYTLGAKALAYLVIGTLLGLGLHPCAGHFIAEHYEFTPGQETYSYYGFCNYLNFNVGYHNEHHDFPRIPWSKLPLVRKIAPEFYDLPYYDSYVKVIWRYITDPNVGPASRVKRPQKKNL